VNNPHPVPYSIKRHGTNFHDCAAEPIRAPGCIQPHGALLVLRSVDLTILQVSENSPQLFGLTAEQLLGKNIDVLLDGACQSRLRELLDREPIERSPLFAFTFASPLRGASPLDVCVHTIDGLALLEFEPAGRGDSPPPDFLATMKRTSAKLQAAGSVAELAETAAAEIRNVTGLDRVMIYRFHPDGSGEVFAEARRDDLPAWLGLRYPADDIPVSVREIFRKLTVRPLPDARSGVAELVPLENPDTRAPIELTHCALRGASVMYTEYLANMGVAASLTMPLLRDGELWGLVACHHQEPRPFPYDVRAIAEFLAHMVSLELRATDAREHAGYLKRMHAVHLEVVTRAAAEGGLAVMVEPAPRLLDGIECGGAAVFHRDRWWSVGATPSPTELEKLGAWLRSELARTSGPSMHFSSDRLGTVYPPAQHYADVASGVLCVPVTNNFQNLLLWFRPEVERTVNWAGNPGDKPQIPGPNGPRLTPRASFALWKEQVRGSSAPWLPFEIDAALQLRLLVMELVVSRAEQIAALNHDLARSNEELDAFAYVASHDLKEPLRGIHKYASGLREFAKSGRPLDEVAKTRLDSLLRLTMRMDGLISSLLHFSRVGRLALEMEAVDSSEVVEEALEMLGAWRHEPDVQITVDPVMPMIHCDRVRVREIFSNLVVNALKYNDSALKKVQIGCVTPSIQPVAWREAARASPVANQVIFFVRDNGIGIEARHHQQIFGMFKRLHARDSYGGGSGAGLAITRKMVEQHGGVIWLESERGTGSTFYMTLSAPT